MSDATLPAPRSSSAAPHIESRNRSDSSSGEGDFDTSLDSSSGGIGKDSGATEYDGRHENKQKRKRTSPQDQAILEAEYKQNPKPNKAARAEIVEKVTLNEKEVQIWFQNRRQINRRKSRPLLPHEIAAFGLGGLAALSSDPASMLSFGSSRGELITNSQPEGISSQEEHKSSQPTGDATTFTHTLEGNPSDTVNRFCAAAADRVVAPMLKEEVSLPAGPSFSDITSSIRDNVVKSFSFTPGYLSNRWNTISTKTSSFSTPVSTQAFSLTTPPISTANQPASCPERIDESITTPSSSIRLSMSLDGKAELVSSKSSPPRESALRPTSSSGLPQKRIRGLQRSLSAFPSIRPSLGHSNPAPYFPRLPTGRSRDARTWEFCSDGEARDELTLQAENESHGSAVAAISLIRSTSNTALKPNTNKRNAPGQKQDAGKYGKRPKLGRAMSSLARLQSPLKASTKSNKPGHSKDDLMYSPSGDSDKENWLPHENGGNPRRRPLPSSRVNSDYSCRSVLSDNLKIPTHAGDFGISKNRKRKGGNAVPEIFEDEENGDENAPAGDEVERFMRGEISPSKKGDLDCVQGLLSLSQGNWR